MPDLVDSLSNAGNKDLIHSANHPEGFTAADAIDSSKATIMAPGQGMQFTAADHRLAEAYGTTRALETAGDAIRDEDSIGITGMLAREFPVPKSAWQAHLLWFRRASLEAASLGLRKPRPRRSIYGLPVISPFHAIPAAWLALMTLMDIFYTAFWVPLGVAFCTDSFGDLSAGCTIAEFVGGIVYTLNMLLGFWFGALIVHDFKKIEVLDGPRLALYYIKYGRFWLDAIAVVPFIYLVVVIGTRGTYANGDDPAFWVYIFSLVRLIRLLRLVSLSKVVTMSTMSGRYQDMVSRFKLSTMGIYTIMLGYFMAVVLNLEACLLLMSAYLNGYENSFLTAVTWEDFTTVSEPVRWYCGLYYVITTSTTTGYGDFTPRNTSEQVLVNIYMIVGMVLFGLLVGTVANALTRASGNAAQLYSFHKKVGKVSHWLESHSVPDRTRKQVQDYFSDVWVNRSESSLDTEIFGDLPSHLRTRVAQYVTMDLVIRTHILRDQEDGLQELVAQHLRPVDVTPGHDICRQGEEGDRLWICAEGDVLAIQHSAEPCYLRPPCMFGESVILGDDMPTFRVRPWTMRTRGIVRLWELRLTDLWPIMRMYPRLREDLLEYIRAQLLLELGYTGGAMGTRADDSWCESVASISQALFKQSVSVVEAAVAELRAANVEDGSLQALLDGLLEFSSIKTKRVVLVAQPAAPPAATSQQQQQQPQSAPPQQQQQQQPVNGATPVPVSSPTAGAAPGGPFGSPSQHPFANSGLLGGAGGISGRGMGGAATSAGQVLGSLGGSRRLSIGQLPGPPSNLSVAGSAGGAAGLDASSGGGAAAQRPLVQQLSGKRAASALLSGLYMSSAATSGGGAKPASQQLGSSSKEGGEEQQRTSGAAAANASSSALVPAGDSSNTLPPAVQTAPSGSTDTSVLPGALVPAGGSNTSGQQAVQAQQIIPVGGNSGSTALQPVQQGTAVVVGTQAQPLVLHPCLACGRHVCGSCGQVVTHPPAGAQLAYPGGFAAPQALQHSSSLARPMLPGLPPRPQALGPPSGIGGGPGGHVPGIAFSPYAGMAGAAAAQATLAGGGAPGSATGGTSSTAPGSSATPQGSGLLGALGAGVNRGNAGTRGHWRPMARSSRTFSRGQHGIVTMSIAQGGQSNRGLGVTSIPIENFGEGYGLWG